MADDQDAVDYARNLTAELDNLNQLAAAVDHKCEPKWWPHRLGEHWTCDTCGHGYHTEYARNMPGETSAKAIRLGILHPDTLGWCSDE